jgi:glucose-6-phosphate 1-dehydrogenase
MVSAIVHATSGQSTNKASLPQADPALLIIFGASGDLTRRKLIPALYDLTCVGCVPRKFEVLGVGRTRMTTEEFRARMRQGALDSGGISNLDSEQWASFEKRLFYLVGDSGDLDFYPRLAAKLEQMHDAGSRTNHLFYISTPASVAGPIIEGLGSSGLNQNEKGWARIVLEKPFAHDLESAQELNRTVLRTFDESNVYRIDHYLGKETVQNILVFRFGNSLFEPVWNRNYVDYVEITAAETVGVENRASFYEETGALRDMVANHMLQLVALTAMEPPIAFDADAVREQKVQVFRSIRPMSVEEVAYRTVRGQYGPGQINGHQMPGYRDEPGVRKNSSTETYVALEFYIDNWRWAGVPFFVRTGKRLARRLTEISIHFKRTPQALFARTPDEEIDPNVITLGIQPDEGITVKFGAKRPAAHMQVAPVEAEFSYRGSFGAAIPEAYTTLLLDAMRGDATLFTRGDEVEAEWRIITPIEEAWAQLPPPSFPNYAAGSSGPADADALVAGDQHRWRELEQPFQKAA